MDRKILNVFVVLAVTITLRAHPITAEPRDAQPSQPNSSQQPQPTPAQAKSPNQERAAPGQTKQPPAQPSPASEVFRPTNESQPTTRQEQSTLDRFLDKSSEPILWVTVAIAVFAFWQVKVYRQMRDHTMVIERAYVELSHNQPGLVIDDLVTESASAMTQGDGVPRQNIGVNMQVQNSGNTPATVTFRLLQLTFTNQPLPNIPAYDSTQGEIVRVHLVKGESFNVFLNWNVEASAVEAVRTVQGMALYLLGYVDYIDKFGQRHRAGYARVYNPSIDNSRPFVLSRLRHGVGNELDVDAYGKRNNLPFVTQPGYNYDRKRVKGEGNDWE